MTTYRYKTPPTVQAWQVPPKRMMVKHLPEFLSQRGATVVDGEVMYGFWHIDNGLVAGTWMVVIDNEPVIRISDNEEFHQQFEEVPE